MKLKYVKNKLYPQHNDGQQQQQNRKLCLNARSPKGGMPKGCRVGETTDHF